VELNFTRLKHATLLLIFFLLISAGYLAPPSSFADETWSILPLEPLFAPLIGNFKEPSVSVIPVDNNQNFEANVGGTAELIRWKSASDMEWGVGVFGGAFFLFQDPSLSQLKVIDWTSGFYVSEKTGPFCFRAEFKDEKSDLGDEYEYTPPANALDFYDWHNNNLTVSFNPTDQFRAFAGGGAKVFWELYDPSESLAFAFCGAELYSSPFSILNDSCRVYGTYYIKYQDQAGGTFDQEIQLGLQWKGDATKRRALRLAAVYYNGYSPYGRFSDQPNDQYLSIGLFIDP